MFFESNENVYEVINVLYSGQGYDNYHCRVKNGNYILIRLKSEQLKYFISQMLAKISDDGQFNDICETFTSNDALVIVLKEYPIRDRWSDYLSENDYTFRERIEFIYRILAGLCVHDAPVEIACDILKHGNIGISSDGNANCYYDLRELDNYEDYKTMEQFCSIFAKQIWNVFSDEIVRKPYEELRRFYEDIGENAPKDFLELFKRYNEVYEIFLGKIEKGQLSENAEANKLKWLAENGVKFVKTAVIVCIIAAAVWVLVLSFLGREPEGTGAFSQIGDLKINEYVPPEE